MAAPPSGKPEKGVLIPPPKRAGLRSRAARPITRSLTERQQPANMVCQRCGAEFAWERADKPGSPNTAWSARLVKGSEKCDCGYGLRSRNKRGPHP